MSRVELNFELTKILIRVDHNLQNERQVLADENGGKDYDGPVDFQGNPVNMSKTGGWLGAGLILGR